MKESALEATDNLSGRIFIVDDEPAIRDVCAAALTHYGYTVGTSGEPEQVLGILQNTEWDLLLSDINMPGMDGIALLREIRAWDPDFPVVLFTGYGTYDKALHALRLGADDFLTKPIRIEDLRRSVQSVLAKKLHRKERERRRVLERLLSMGVALAREVQEEKIFALLQDAAQQETGAGTVSIMRRTVEGGVEIVYSAGAPTIDKDQFGPLLGNLCEQVFETGQACRIGNVSSDERFSAHPAAGRIGSFMCLPLTQSDRVVEVLTLVTREHGTTFTPSDEEAASALVLHGAVALERARLFQRLTSKINETHELFYGTVHAISNALDAKSPWTKGHSERVMTYAIMIGRQLGLGAEDLENLELAALLHDVGKIGTYDALLEKPGGLTESEYALMKEHPAKGEEILRPLQKLAPVLPAIRNHHERYDGLGYPDGLRAEEIPLFGRILTVADTYDSMTSTRPYRNTPGRPQALAELQQYAGVQFDPLIVDAFLMSLTRT